MSQTPYAYINSLFRKGSGRMLQTVAHNTAIVGNDDGSVSVWFHTTEIVRAYGNGRTILRNGGHATTTTKQRLNGFLPGAWCAISQKDWEWNVLYRTNGRETETIRICPFTDHMTITFDDIGRIVSHAPYVSVLTARRVNQAALAFTIDTDQEPTVENVDAWNRDYLANGYPIGPEHVQMVAERAAEMIAAGVRPTAA